MRLIALALLALTLQSNPGATISATADAHLMEDFNYAPAGSFDPATKFATAGTWRLTATDKGPWILNGLNCEKLATNCTASPTIEIRQASGDVRLGHENAETAAKNRIVTTTSGTLRLGVARVTYDVPRQRWVVLSFTGR